MYVCVCVCVCVYVNVCVCVSVYVCSHAHVLCRLINNLLTQEIGVILLSTSPDHCFVRDITGAKRKCAEGSVKLQEVNTKVT